jgi:SpoVK/Ycf46/Vps4 family AAA+-type ATPase
VVENQKLSENRKMESGQLHFETLKSSLLFNFRTGNVAIDTLITGLIICLSTYLINLASKIQNMDWHDIYEKWFGKQPEPEPSKNIINISGKKVDGYQSDAFLALIYRIKKLNCAKSNISQLSEIRMTNDPDNSDYDSSDDEEVIEMLEKKNQKGANLIVSQPTPFIIAENVEGVVNQHTSKTESDEDKNSKNNDLSPHEEYQTITISSAIHSMDDLRSMLNQWIKEHRDSTKPDDYLRYFNFTESYYDENKYKEYRFDSGKSFDNIFFPQKASIIERIKFFAENKEWYRKRGIPRTLGFMFYGKPGCGKTSTIKAIANYTQRHIVSVPLSKMKSCNELLGIFYNTRIEAKYIPLDKRLYVLEDIDADGLKDIIADRKRKNSESSNDESFNLFSDDDEDANENDATKALLKHIMMSKKGKNKKGGFFGMMTKNLSLAGILEVLDGVMEMDGRMLVMTTNYPERLDEALIRPGRIDVKVNFGKCTSKCLIEMHEHFFEDTHYSKLWPLAFDKHSLPTDRWTPAEAAQILLGNTHDPHQALEHFVKEFPKSTFHNEDSN